jgi:hypothetical protein
MKEENKNVGGFKKNLNQLNLLLWKNYRLQVKSIIGLILELTVPALFAIILLPIRTIVKSEQLDYDTFYSTFDLRNFTFKSYVLAYQPNNSALVNRIMEKTRDDLKINLMGIFKHEF